MQMRFKSNLMNGATLLTKVTPKILHDILVLSDIQEVRNIMRIVFALREVSTHYHDYV